MVPTGYCESESKNESENESESDELEEQEDSEHGGEGSELQEPSHSQPSANPVERDGADSLAFRDRFHFQLSLRVLGLMCDGQNRHLQVHTYNTFQVSVYIVYTCSCSIDDGII